MSAKPIQAIDHLLTYVHDLDVATSLFQRMGFTLSPVSRIEAMGIINHLVLMQPVQPGCANFIELMAVQEAGRLPSAMARLLSGCEGIKSIVLGTRDAEAAHAAIVREGFNVGAPVHVKREWVTGPNESVFPEFDVILPFEAPLGFNACRYFNVELYLRPEWLQHPNGARRVTSVFVVSVDPNPLRSFAALFGEPALVTEGVGRVGCGGVDLVILSPQAARNKFGADLHFPDKGSAYLGYEIEVASLDTLESSLTVGGVAYRRHLAAIQVDPDEGLGNLIMFRERAEP